MSFELLTKARTVPLKKKSCVQSCATKAEPVIVLLYPVRATVEYVLSRTCAYNRRVCII